MDLGPHAAFIWTSYGIVAFVLLALVANLLHPLRKKPEALLVLGPLPFEFRPAGLLWVVGRRRKKGGGGGCKDSAVRHSKPKSGQAMRLSQGNRP